MKLVLFAVCFWTFSIPSLNATTLSHFYLEKQLNVLNERVTELEVSERNFEAENANLHARIDLLEEKYKEIKRLYGSVNGSVSTTTESSQAQPTSTAPTTKPTNTSQGFLIKTLDGNRCLEGTREGPAVFAPCASGPSQIWRYSNNRLKNVESSLCLTLSSITGSELRNEMCQESNIRQIWIQNGQACKNVNGLCLVSGFRQVNVAASVNENKQKFRMESVPIVSKEKEPIIPSRKLKNEEYGTCFYAARQGKSYSQPCLSSPAEEWWYSASDYTIKNKFSGLCLDSRTEYDLTVEDCDAGNTQKWIPVGNNGFRHVEFGKCLTAGVISAMTFPCNLSDKRQQFP